MLTIRKEQMKVLSDYMTEQFVEQTASHLRSNFSKETGRMSEGVLKDIITTGITKAADYNIKRRADVRTFTEFIIIYGTDFDKNPTLNWISKVLNNKSLNPSEKMWTLNNIRKGNKNP